MNLSPQWRKLVCGAFVLILPVSSMPQESSRAMLHSDSSVLLNGSPTTSSSALFPNDVVETPKGVAAKIDAQGSTATILPDTRLQFEGDEIFLEHGGLQIKTDRQMRVRVNCMTVVPVSAEWTEFDVSDISGQMTVAANQKDVKIHYPANAAKVSKRSSAADVIIHESEKTTRDEHCGVPGQTETPGKVPFLDTIWAKIAGGGLIAATCYIICRSGEPISPDKP
jgi:hypothetical protein